MAGDGGLTQMSYVVLGLLASLGPSTPYDLKRAAAGSLGNLWSFPHSQFYAEPERLAGAGLVQERRESRGRRRRTYSLAPRGRRALMRWLTDPTISGHELRDPGLLKLFFGDLVGAESMEALARTQAESHQSRATEYDQLTKESEENDLPFQAASMRMGLIFERASVRFWRTVAEQLSPSAKKRVS